MSNPSQSDYRIGRVGAVCHASGHALSPGDQFVGTLIAVEEDPGVARQDFSREAWDDGHRPAGLLAYWRGVIPAPNRPSRPMLDADSALDLFEQLAGDEDPDRIAFRYVLALMLLRKKILTMVGKERGVILVRARGEPDESAPLEIPEPALDREAIEALSPVVSDLLGIES